MRNVFLRIKTLFGEIKDAILIYWIGTVLMKWKGESTMLSRESDKKLKISVDRAPVTEKSISKCGAYKALIWLLEKLSSI